MYTLIEDDKYISIIFKEGDVKNTTDTLYEKDNFLITGNKIYKVFSLYDKSLFNYKNNSYRIKISKKTSESFSILNNETTKSAYQFCNPINDLIKPIFLKNLLRSGTDLKNHQKNGINWLAKDKIRLLADDMGLGKTLQTITYSSELIHKGEIKSVIVVCPTSLVFNWCHEIKKWLPDFSVTQISNTGKENKNDFWDIIYESAHFIVTSYDHLRVLPKVLTEEKIDLLIADEVHKLRKKTSKISKSIRLIDFERFWGLTGTPIEKDTNDLINLLTLMDKRLNDETLKTYSNNYLSVLANTYMLRRMKSDVLKDLKKFQETDILLELNDDQKEKYKKLELSFSNIKSNDLLKTFGKLKQLCDIDIKNGSSSKIDYVEDALEKISSMKEKCVIFSFWLEPLKELKRRLDKNYTKEFSIIFDGSMDKKERNDAINFFQENSNCRAILCSGKIGGEGINLTEANHVIFINDWWNPSNNNQARDRVVRIGQSRECFITHLKAIDTIDERVSDILKEKKSINAEVIETLVVKLQKELKDAS